MWIAHPEIPLVWAGVGDDIVIANGDEGAIVEERDEHQHEDWQLEECRPLRSITDIACFTRSFSMQCYLILVGLSSAPHLVQHMYAKSCDELCP